MQVSAEVQNWPPQNTSLEYRLFGLFLRNKIQEVCGFFKNIPLTTRDNLERGLGPGRELSPEITTKRMGKV